MAIVTGNHFIYTVRPGDTLFVLANQSGSSIEAIERANALYPPFTDRNLIYPGQVLVITQRRNNMSYSVAYVINQGDSLYRIGQKFSSRPDLLIGLNPQIINPNVIYADALLNVPVFIYEVEEGDSLYAISNTLGIPLHQIIAANQSRAGFSPDVIFIGYRLILPIPSSTNIIVFTPLPGTRIRPGQTIAGIARAFEAVIDYQIKDDNGVIVTKERYIMTSEAGPAYGTYAVAAEFDQPPTSSGGELWVYSRSAEDGRMIDLVKVRVYFDCEINAASAAY